jgi:glutamine amidotransferase
VIAIVDYGRGNLYSLSRAIEAIGGRCLVTDRPEQIAGAEAVILPGVGAFADAVAGLEERGLTAVLAAVAREGTPLLGICLGMQLLFEASSEFGSSRGLGLIPGRVDRLPQAPDGSAGLRIPNVGWRRVERRGNSALLGGCSASPMFYFVHSYVPEPADEADVRGVLAFNGREVAVLVEHGNIFGCQFHPEKSGTEGLNLLRGFLEVVQDQSRSLGRDVASA